MPTLAGVSGHSFQSTLPLRGATRQRAGSGDLRQISIHTPLAGSDGHGAVCVHRLSISIHTPLAGSDLASSLSTGSMLFQSTLPLRGATPYSRHYQTCQQISIHTPLAGSDHRRQRPHDHIRISIHAPLAGSDTTSTPKFELRVKFQSTLPLRGAT